MKAILCGNSDDGQQSPDERVRARCREARILKEASDHESARRALDEWWPPESARPRTDGLGLPAVAELLLLAGMLTGSLGSAKQIPGAQPRAKKLIVESIRLFEQAGLWKKAAEAQAELALCHWRAGNHEDGWRVLSKAIAAMGDGADAREAKALALLRAAAFEEQSGRLAKALSLLRSSARLLDSGDSPVLLGKLHNNLGLILTRLGEEPGREDFLGQALNEYAAASDYFERAGATRLLAYAHNNWGLVLILLGAFGEADEHLELARNIFTELGDEGNAAQVDETRARKLLAEKLYKEAERVAAEAVRVLEAGERPSVLAEALTTLGVALARVGRPNESCALLGRAMDIAEKVGAREIAGKAALVAVEVLCGYLDPEEAVNLYEFASSRLEGTGHARTLLRLSKVARTVYAPWRVRNSSPEAPDIWASARRLAANNSPALIIGKSAKAIQLLACYAHALSGRPGRFLVIDCDTIEDEAPRSDFFEWAMHEAAGGMLFLKKPEELSRHLQLRLRHLVRQSFGEHAPDAPRREHLAARIVAGTSCDLSREVALECFDAELFEALGGRGPYSAPSSREFEELRLLVVCFDEEAFGRYDRPRAGLPEEEDDDEWSVTLDECVNRLKIELIRKALVLEGGSTGKAAARLHMPRQTLEGAINNRKYPELQQWRTPPVKRRRAAKRPPRTTKKRSGVSAGSKNRKR